MRQFYREPAQIATALKAWLQGAMTRTGAKGFTFGLSGGADSAALAALLRSFCADDELLGVIMPAHSLPQDEEHAMTLVKALNIPICRVDLTSAYDEALAAIEASAGPISEIAAVNIKPRLRMITLYAIARERNFLVCGAGNRDEFAMGYFTKHGDSGVDLLPFGNLLKGEIFALASHLGVPDVIVQKPPSAGLWPGQTDEAEMGVTYEELDRYLALGHCDPAAEDKIKRAIAASAHKRSMPPIAEIPEII